MITDPELAAVLLIYTVNRFLVYPNIQSTLDIDCVHDSSLALENVDLCL